VVITDATIREAMDDLRALFYRTQDADTGRWNMLQYAGTVHEHGVTALVTLALLVSGESFQNPPLRRAVEHLQKAPLEGTYDVALRAHVFAQLPEPFEEDLRRTTNWLLNAHDGKSRYRYTREPTTYDHSATQYGLLGVWEAAKRGVPVEPQFWEEAVAHFMAGQNADGGWGYDAGGESYASMTAAGLTVLMIGRDQVHRRVGAGPEELHRAIRRSTRWLDQRFAGHRNVGLDRFTFYYLYSIERVGLASGLRNFRGANWYLAGAEHILRRMANPDDDQPPEMRGSVNQSLTDSAFALMFLARGRFPVAITKFQHPTRETDPRPADIANFTRLFSDLREREFNFQTLSLDRPPTLALASPVAFLSTGDAIELTERQRAHLKQFIDFGGTLVINPELGSGRVIDWAKQLARDMFPRYEPRTLDRDHPIFTTLFPLRTAGELTVFGVSNGARELIVIPGRDWGMQFQSPSSAVGPNVALPWAWRAMTNLLIHTSDRGRIEPWLQSRAAPHVAEPKGDGAAPATPLTIVRARYDGNWDVEPAAWRAMAETMRREMNVQPKFQDLPLTDIAATDAPIVHLAGVEPVELTDPQLRAIITYAERGGLLLIEAVGGKTLFALNIEEQLKALLGTAAFRLTHRHPLINGSFDDRAHDLRRVTYRRFAALRQLGGRSPRLNAFFHHDRPSIVLTNEDLACALVGADHWGIIGYTPESARRIAANLLLSARGRRLAPIAD